MSWITSEQVFAIHTKTYDVNDIPIRPYAELIERGIAVDREDFVIAYQLCFNRVEDEYAKEMGVEDAYDLDCVFCDTKGNTLDVDGLYDVFVDKSYFETALKDIKENWRSKITDDIYDKLNMYKKGEVVGVNLRPSLKRKIKEYEFLLQKYFPALYAVIPDEILNRGTN